MIKAVLYARVSSKDQERQGYSIPAQVELIREYARQENIEIVQEFLESESAGKAGRTKFTQMLSLLRKNSKIKAVLVEKNDRLYRNFKDKVILSDIDVDIHYAKDRRVFGKNSRPSEKFLSDIETAQSGFFLYNLSEEVKKGQRQKANQGSYPGGIVPIGFKRDVVKKKIELDPERAPLVFRMFELYATGRHSIDSLHAEAKKLNLSYPRSGRVIARSEIERMLKKDFYAGKFWWNGIRHDGDHPAIVEQELFNRVQEAFRKRSIGKFTTREFTYIRMMSCGDCGHAITAEIKKKRYIYYHCTGYGNRHPKSYVSEKEIETQFSGLVKNVTLPYDWYQFIKTSLDQELKTRVQSGDQEREQILRERERIQHLLRKTYLDKLDGTITDEFFREMHNEFQRKLDGLSHRLSLVQAGISLNADLAIKAIELSYQAESLYVTATSEQKRKLLDSLLSNSTLKGKTVCATYRKPFDILAEGIASENLRRGRDSLGSIYHIRMYLNAIP